MPLRVGAILQSRLKQRGLASFASKGNGAGILDGVCQRSFAISVFTSFKGLQRNVFMQMRWSRNDDALDVIVCEDCLVVGRLDRARSGGCIAPQLGRINVADCGNVGDWQTAYRVQNLAAPASETDHCNFNLGTGSLDISRWRWTGIGQQFHTPEHSHQSGDGTAFQKIASIVTQRIVVGFLHTVTCIRGRAARY